MLKCVFHHLYFRRVSSPFSMHVRHLDGGSCSACHRRTLSHNFIGAKDMQEQGLGRHVSLD